MVQARETTGICTQWCDRTQGAGSMYMTVFCFFCECGAPLILLWLGCRLMHARFQKVCRQ
jgi:hypothetical protein